MLTRDSTCGAGPSLPAVPAPHSGTSAQEPAKALVCAPSHNNAELTPRVSDALNRLSGSVQRALKRLDRLEREKTGGAA